MFIMCLGVLSDEGKALVDRIYEKYNKSLYRVAIKMLKNENDAQDALSQTFLNISEHIKKISSLPEDEIAPYCVVITKNASADILRFRNRVASFSEIKDPDRDLVSDVERQFLEIEDQRRLLRAVEKLPQKDRHLIHMRFVYKMEYKEIAQILDIGEYAARKRGQRVIKKLRNLYEAEESERE